MTDWCSLNHAYGSAEDIPAILADLAPGEHEELWSELWSRVCHQGTVYSASYSVLPALLDLAKQWPVEHRAPPIGLAGAIVVGESASGGHAAALAPHAAVLAELHLLALEGARATGLSEADFLAFAEAALALAGNRLWGSHLNRLLTGDFEGICRECGSDLLLVVGEYGFFVGQEEWVNRPATPRRPIRPVEPPPSSELGRYLHEMAVGGGQTRIACWLTYLFGSSTCPACARRFELESAVEQLAHDQRSGVAERKY